MSVEFGVVNLVLTEDVPNRGQKFTGNRDNGFLAAATFFESLVFIFEFGAFVGLPTVQRDLNKERFQIRSRTPDASGFLLARALLILRSKTSP